MLTAAQRPSRTFLAAAQKLQLPWLCPAYYQLAGLGPPGKSSTDRSEYDRRIQGTIRRHSSFAVPSSATLPGGHDPAEFLSSFPPSPPFSGPVSNIRSWHPSKPLIIHPHIASKTLIQQDGIGGDVIELHQNLHACLFVGRFDRAAAIVRRLIHIFEPNSSELVEAHNLYLRSSLDALHRGAGGQNMTRLQRWFEVEMRQRGIRPNSTTIAIMCRSAFLMPQGGPRTRTLRRYLHIAEEYGILEDTMASGEYTTDEWEELCRVQHEDVCPSQEIESAVSKVPDLDQYSKDPDPLPKITPVKAVDQRGLGLSTLKQSLRFFVDDGSVPYPNDYKGTLEEKEEIWARRKQRRLEEEVVTAEMDRWRSEHAHMIRMGINPALQLKSMEATKWEWHTRLETAIKELIEELRGDEKKPAGEKRHFGPYLEQLPLDKVAAITIATLFRNLATEGVHNGATLSLLAKDIGSCLELESKTITHNNHGRGQAMRINKSTLRRKALKGFNSGSSNPKPQTVIKNLKTVEQLTLDYRRFDWPQTVKIEVGAALVTKFIEVAFFPCKAEASKNTRLKPAFEHKLVWLKGKRLGKVFPNHDLAARLQKEPLKWQMAHQLPMLSKPNPWRGLKGGYLRYPSKFMRTKDYAGWQDMYAVAAIKRGDMNQVFAGLDVLGKTEWCVNRDVFNVMLEAWNSGEKIADIPAENPQFEYPPKPTEDADEIEKRKYKWLVRDIDNEKSGLHSQRCFVNMQLEIASAYLHQKRFYFPHNIDFRGRAYPIPPILNHMGADHARGLLRFSEGRPLGKEGLMWLKIHLANMYGHNKQSLDERVYWAENHIADIYDSAENPLRGRRWWLKADDPWQCLACCIEMKGALDSEDPANYISHLPIHQDGTCNGLQHYAALGGDLLGATQVNLVPGDRPADIYSEVARLVEKDIAKDKEDGNELAKALYEKIPGDQKISRKIVKQTVMTNVYGVTFVGARAQVQKQLDDIILNNLRGHGNNYVLSLYIATKVFKALGDMFGCASQLMRWLATCAGKIATALSPDQIQKLQAQLEGTPTTKEDGKPAKRKTNVVQSGSGKRKAKADRADFQSSVIWTTPLKLPIVQPYRTSRVKVVKTRLQQISFRNPKLADQILKRKQMQAFPPNFVHSLDATHMLLSALKCDEAGLTFAAVHDSFWTHAADVPQMSSILREAFIRMHSEDIMGRLVEEFRARHSGFMQATKVWADSPLGKRIVALRYSMGPARNSAGKRITRAKHELIEEYQRLRLSNSTDPMEREKGEKMVTPGSLFAQVEPGSADLLAEEEEEEVPAHVAVAKEDLEMLAEGRDSAGQGDVLDEESSAVPSSPAEEMLSTRSDVGESRTSQAAPSVGTGKKKKRKRQMLNIWVPLTFPPLPEKGELNLSSLKDSPYFFS